MDVQELLYVGEHRSARHGLQHDGHRDKWHAFPQPEEEIWYAVGLCGSTNRERLAAAMINAHKPRFNSDSPYLERFPFEDRKSTRLNSSHVRISYAVFCLKKKKQKQHKRNNKINN